jgi:hypothetical protein
MRLLCAAQTQDVNTRKRTDKQKKTFYDKMHVSTISLTLVWVVAVGTTGRGETSPRTEAGSTAAWWPRGGAVDSVRA